MRYGGDTKRNNFRRRLAARLLRPRRKDSFAHQFRSAHLSASPGVVMHRVGEGDRRNRLARGRADTSGSRANRLALSLPSGERMWVGAFSAAVLGLTQKRMLGGKDVTCHHTSRPLSITGIDCRDDFQMLVGASSKRL